MISTTTTGNSIFSTEVCLSVEVGCDIHSVSAVGHDRLVLAQPQQIGECDGVLVITVNGEPRRTPIRLSGSAAPAREYSYALR